MGVVVDHWVISKGLGTYGPDSYMKRAVVAAFGWPANQEKDAVYPYTEVDSAGQKLTGANTYTLTFPKEGTPPVNGFWSITMYMIDGGWWFVPNPLNKFTVSPRDNPKFNADGSLTLYFQNESPGADKEANWLPAPKASSFPCCACTGPRTRHHQSSTAVGSHPRWSRRTDPVSGLSTDMPERLTGNQRGVSPGCIPPWNNHAKYIAILVLFGAP